MTPELEEFCHDQSCLFRHVVPVIQNYDALHVRAPFSIFPTMAPAAWKRIDFPDRETPLDLDFGEPTTVAKHLERCEVRYFRFGEENGSVPSRACAPRKRHRRRNRAFQRSCRPRARSSKASTLRSQDASGTVNQGGSNGSIRTASAAEYFSGR